MLHSLTDRIHGRLMAEFSFKERGEWLREGHCPHCTKKSLWTHAQNPRVVTCDRINKCGYSAHVRDLFDDLFKDWSEYHPQTEENPNAAADAYLFMGRHFDLTKLKGCYTQERYTNKEGISSSTVRFKLSNGDYWERLIDRPERFGKDKARFNYGAKAGSTGVWWIPPWINLIDHTEIWITEGIFDAIALAQHGICAVSCLSCNNYPSQGLEALFDECKRIGEERPRLIWAFDNDKAGHIGTHKFHERATKEGWESTAAQPPKNATVKIDWNDLHERERLTEEHLKLYRYYGKLLVAPSAEAAGLLIYNQKDGMRKSFPFYHRMRLYWFNLDMDKYHKAMERLEDEGDLNEEELRHHALRNCSAISEICNAYIDPLYFQRSVATDDSWYFIRIATQTGEVKSTFTGDQIASTGKFKPRLLSIFPGVLWTGTPAQLDYCLKNSIEGLREVQTIDYIGYSKEHKTYFFNKIAFHNGRHIEINEHDYFKIGRIEAKSLATKPEINVSTAKLDVSWYPKYWRTRGAKGIVVLAWWMGSYFAEQIRALDNSYPFLEIVGQPGAGKSHLIEFLWKLSGRLDYEGFNPNKSTAVGMWRNFAQVSNLPIALIEGDKEDDGDKQRFDWDILKDAFNGRPIRTRGNKNNGNDTYEPPFRGTILISQNSTIQATEAILTRTLHTMFDRSGHTMETKAIADELHRIPIEVTSTFMAHCIRNETNILDTYISKVREYEAGYHAKGITHTRIALCHAQLAALVDALALHVLNDYIDLEHVIEATKMIEKMAVERVARLSADHPQVQQFWDVYDYLTGLRDVAINHHAETHNTIAINLNDFYKYAADHRQNLPDITIMKRLLPSSTSRKFVESNKSTRSACRSSTVEDRITKCWIFEKAKGDRK